MSKKTRTWSVFQIIKARDLVSRLAKLHRDTECLKCKGDGEEDNPNCEAHEPFYRSQEESQEILNTYIEWAREILNPKGEPKQR